MMPHQDPRVRSERNKLADYVLKACEKFGVKLVKRDGTNFLLKDRDGASYNVKVSAARLTKNRKKLAR